MDSVDGVGQGSRNSLQCGDKQWTRHTRHILISLTRIDQTYLHYNMLAKTLAWWLPCACSTTARLPDPRAQPPVESRLRIDDSNPPQIYSLECSLYCLHGLSRC